MISTRLLAFATLDPALWGTSWVPQGSDLAALAVAAGGLTAVLPAELRSGDPDAPWTLAGDAVSLRIEAAEPSRGAQADGERAHSVDSLAQVTGHVVLDGVEHELSCPGWRAAIEADLAPDELDSFRHVAGWVGTEDGMVVHSLRLTKSRGHEDDLVLASVLQSPQARAVVDPRLSTTYTAAGAPARTGLELWFEEASADLEPASEPPYPRRAAGEAVGSGIEWAAAGMALYAELLRWHTRGEEGAGVYLLGRRP